ncbi:DUF1289 domain-containing protein [Maricaulis sp.]|uniref:DUF1289 domain-containing protein n=2 Tax=Maricaulis TaxID=74317 RepID=UPI0026295AC8|nr:DUF1289 domain-containing protein [Maricaulis sp.]
MKAGPYSAHPSRCKHLPQRLAREMLQRMTSTPINPPIKTPCVQVCFVDPKAQLCVGCFRTMEELGRWTRYTDDERAAIMTALPERETAYKAAKPVRQE